METSIASPRIVLVTVDAGDPVSVLLECGDEQATGRCYQATTSGIVEAAGMATIDALGQLTPPAVSLALRWSGVVEPGAGLPTLVVVIAAVEVAGVPMRYAGAVLADDDLAAAAARSVLHALNRRLEIMAA